MGNAHAAANGTAIEYTGARWGWFLAVGIALILAGLFAIAAPVVSTAAVSLVLGLALAFGGVVRIVQSFQVREWAGFVWNLLIGVVEVIGGILIYMNPFAGAVALTIVIAAVFAVQGITQLGLALGVRPQPGWHWLLVSGLIALVAAVLLAIKLPYSSAFTPGTVAGIALMFGGGAYLAIAYAVRKAR